MSTSAEQQARKRAGISKKAVIDNCLFEQRLMYNAAMQMHEWDKERIIDECATLWYNQFVGFFKEGLAKNIVDEFKENLKNKL